MSMKYSLKQLLEEYSQKNTSNLYEPVAVGRYGIRKRSDIYKKELASDYSKNKLIFQDTMTIGLGSKQIDFGVLTENKTYSVSPAYKTFKIDTSKVLSAYLELILDFNNNYYSQKYLVAGARQGKKVDLKGLFSEEIDVPDIEKQSEIINSISLIKEAEKKGERILELLEELRLTYFFEMFGDLQTDTKGLNKVPMGDYITTLTDFSANGSYETLDSGVTMYDKPNYAWMVRTTDLETGDMNSIKYIDKKAYELLSKSKIYGGELIMNKIGSAGKVFLMPSINMPASLGRNAFLMRFDERINVRFLFEQLITAAGQTEIQRYVRGTTTKTISKDGARSISIIVPDRQLQDTYVSIIDRIDKLKTEVESRLTLYRELSNKKLYDYLTC